MCLTYSDTYNMQNNLKNVTLFLNFVNLLYILSYIHHHIHSHKDYQ